MSLSDYLAKNYLTADPPPTDRPKKKRKKTKDTTAATTGLLIHDDDPPDLRSMSIRIDGEDEDAPVLAAGRTAEFRRAKKSSWRTVSGGKETTTGGKGGGEEEEEAADAILASAAAEKDAMRGDRDGEDLPTVMGEVEMDEGDAGDDVRMESGAKAGLQTAEQTAAMMESQERRKKAEGAVFKNSPQAALAQDTIYRDASGRIINVAMKRAEARKAEAEKAEKEKQAREAQMGDVQRHERETRRQQLQEAKSMPLTRRIEDEELNEELKGKQLWNDPAAGFLTRMKGPGLSVTGKPLYKGSFQPNRYGIRPGHRWDGVDRGTGFEKEWFNSRNRKGRLENLEYQWQMDE